jgi:phage tail sheath gpL-like
MQSKVVALLGAEGNREATLLVRRADGQFALARIDARVASAARVAASYAAALAREAPAHPSRAEDSPALEVVDA